MLRAFRSLQLLRGFLTAFVLLAFSASALEVIIPDVHDGDTTGSIDASVGSSSTADRQSGGAMSDTRSTRGLIASDFGGSERPSHDGTRPASDHAAHVEHCGHAHVATPASASALNVSRPDHGEAPSTHVATLVSVAVVPTLRPPIA